MNPSTKGRDRAAAGDGQDAIGCVIDERRQRMWEEKIAQADSLQGDSDSSRPRKDTESAATKATANEDEKDIHPRSVDERRRRMWERKMAQADGQQSTPTDSSSNQVSSGLQAPLQEPDRSAPRPVDPWDRMTSEKFSATSGDDGNDKNTDVIDERRRRMWERKVAQADGQQSTPTDSSSNQISRGLRAPLQETDSSAQRPVDPWDRRTSQKGCIAEESDMPNELAQPALALQHDTCNDKHITLQPSQENHSVPESLPGAYAVRGPARGVERVLNTEDSSSNTGSSSLLNHDSPITAVVANDLDSTPRSNELIRQHIVNNAPVIEGELASIKESPKKSKSEWKTVLYRHWKAIILLITSILVGVTLGVTLSSGAATGIPTVTPTQSPNPSNSPTSTRFSGIKSVLEPLSGPGVFDDVTSPQFASLSWLSDVDARQVDASDEVHLTQRYALATLYFATGGETSWVNKCNFLSIEHECFWHAEAVIEGNDTTEMGAICAGSKKYVVDTITLPQNNVTGQLPDEIGLLSSLRRTNILVSENAIEGHIPTSIGSITKMQVLDLSFNHLNNTIPSEMGNMQALYHLDLKENSLSGEIPHSFGRLNELQVLYLHVNKLQGSIPPLGALSKLTDLWLGFNSITGTIPSWINNFAELRYLFLNSANLNGTLPFAANSFPSLHTLKVAKNSFTGSIPQALYTYQNLTHVDLDYNRLIGTLSPDIGNLKNVGLFGLLGNKLNGTIPSTVGTLQTMYWFAVGMNQFSGSIPPELGNLTGLKRLYLSENRFTGSLPPTLGNLVKLQDLQLYMNQFTGFLPTSLAQLTKLDSFGLDNNSFVGDIGFMCVGDNTWNLFMADCYGENPEVTCDCCTACCSDETYGEGSYYGCFPT